jgi:hypothetical protein
MLPPLTTVCCETTAHTMWLLLGSGMITGSLIYTRIVIRSLLASR